MTLMLAYGGTSDIASMKEMAHATVRRDALR